MIINGKYVEYDENSISQIQQSINQNNFLASDLKSDLEKPKEVYNKLNDWDFGMHSLLGFGDVEQTGSRNEAYSYYREMDNMEFIDRGLEVIADDSTQSNTDGDAIKIFSDDERKREILYDLFVERLDMNSELWSIVYETAKMGDNFFEVVPDSYKDPKKIIYLRYLIPDNVYRVEEEDGRLSHFEYRVISENREEKDRLKGEQQEVIYRLQPWQVVHFKVQTDRENDPYGASLLKSGVKTFRRLSLLEDVILVYRISRAPERRVFKINVGNMNYTDAQKFVQKIKEKYRTQSFIDENGNINKKANMLSITSDIFIPVREGGQGTEVDTLQGGEALRTIDDLDYFKNKILRTMNIPLAYLGDESDRSRGGLAQLDVKFSRFIERIQSQVIKGLNKIAALELFFKGYKKDDLNDFALELTPPSNIKETIDLETINQRITLVGSIQSLNIYSNAWILRNIMKHSNREIAEINMEKQQETEQQQQDQDAGEMGFGGGMDMGGGMDIEGEVPADAETPVETPGEEPAEAPAEAPDMETASTIVNIFGKEFLLENKEDFIKLIKIAEKYDKDRKKLNEVFEKSGENTLMEDVNKFFDKKSKKETQRVKTKEIRRQFILNEMGGLEFSNRGSKKSMKLFENKGDGSYIEKEILLEG